MPGMRESKIRIKKFQGSGKTSKVEGGGKERCVTEIFIARGKSTSRENRLKEPPKWQLLGPSNEQISKSNLGSAKITMTEIKWIKKPGKAREGFPGGIDPTDCLKIKPPVQKRGTRQEAGLD